MKKLYSAIIFLLINFLAISVEKEQNTYPPKKNLDIVNIRPQNNECTVSIPISAEEAELDAIKNYYSLCSTFPRSLLFLIDDECQRRYYQMRIAQNKAKRALKK